MLMLSGQGQGRTSKKQGATIYARLCKEIGKVSAKDFVCYCRQGSSLLWTPVRRTLSVQCSCPGRGGELV